MKFNEYTESTSDIGRPNAHTFVVGDQRIALRPQCDSTFSFRRQFRDCAFVSSNVTEKVRADQSGASVIERKWVQGAHSYKRNVDYLWLCFDCRLQHLLCARLFHSSSLRRVTLMNNLFNEIHSPHKRRTLPFEINERSKRKSCPITDFLFTSPEWNKQQKSIEKNRKFRALRARCSCIVDAMSSFCMNFSLLFFASVQRSHRWNPINQ